MSASDRAAAAEARRQKILARGKDRLSQITVGAPATAASEGVGEGAEAREQPAGLLAAAAAAAPVAPPAAATDAAHTEAKAGVRAANETEADSQAENVASAADASPAGPSVLAEAARALAAATTTATTATTATVATIADPSSATTTAAATTAQRSADQRREPSPAAAPSAPSTLAAGPVQRRAPSSGPDQPPEDATTLATAPATTATTTVTAATAGGPTLAAGVSATRLLRALLAMALAYALYKGQLLPEQLPLSPPLLLLVTQAAMIAGARALLGNKGLREWADPSYGAPAAKLPMHLRGIDLTSLIPGLAPAMAVFGALQQVIGGAWDGMALYVVTYVVLVVTKA